MKGFRILLKGLVVLSILHIVLALVLFVDLYTTQTITTSPVYAAWSSLSSYYFDVCIIIIAIALYMRMQIPKTMPEARLRTVGAIIIVGFFLSSIIVQKADGLVFWNDIRMSAMVQSLMEG